MSDTPAQAGTDASIDVVVVGGGIVGLATAWQMLSRRPGIQITVVDAEPAIAGHQTSHNSGVVHAGIYYAPGSLKASLCSRGRGLLKEFCAEHGIPIDHNGKLVVAKSEGELPGLGNLFDRASQNRVPGLRRVDREELRRIEPVADGVAAIHSPDTAVVDFAAVARQLAAEIEKLGGRIRTSWPVSRVRSAADGSIVDGPNGETLRGRITIVCAGLQADRLAAEVAHDVRILPFRGTWYRVTGELADQVRGSIYPVPDPSLPFLGVHVTRRIDGEVWAGPNAFLAFSRHDYRQWAVDARDAVSSLGYTGFWKFAAKNLPTAWTEFSHEVSARAYAKSLKEYVPDVLPGNLERGPMGIRAQAMNHKGQLLDDFLVREADHVLHVLNAPSPAATSSFAIGEYLADTVDRMQA